MAMTFEGLLTTGANRTSSRGTGPPEVRQAAVKARFHTQSVATQATTNIHLLHIHRRMRFQEPPISLQAAADPSDAKQLKQRLPAWEWVVAAI